jgi:hypothetical protein
MARPGPEPKNVKHGHGGAGWIDVPNTPYTGPGSDRDLPPMDGGIRWYPQVEAWWEIVRVMPHCRLWEASDWMFAIMTAYQWQNWWGEYYGGTVHTTASTELRRREDQMGFTLEARRKLGIRYVDPAQAGQEQPTEPEPEPAAGGAPVGATPITAAKSRRERLAG